MNETEYMSAQIDPFLPSSRLSWKKHWSFSVETQKQVIWTTWAPGPGAETATPRSVFPTGLQAPPASGAVSLGQ